MKASCEAQRDHVFYGCTQQMQGLLWKGADRWCVGGYVQLQRKKKKKKGKRSWKKNIIIKIAQHSKVTVCTRPLWLWLYLPLLPVSAWPPPLSYLCFDHYPFFLQTSLLLWLYTQGRTHALLVHVFSPLFFSLSLTPWASPRLWSTSQPWTSLSPFLFLLCCFAIFPCCTSCVPPSLVLRV